jgi:serine/threonine protein kinase
VWQGELPDGQEVAVKKLLDSATGHGLLQLQNEVQVLATLQHKNLVRLHGFCVHQNEIILVYEFIKNGRLDTFLFGILLTSSIGT